MGVVELIFNLKRILKSEENDLQVPHYLDLT